MAKDLVQLNDKENAFIDALLRNGGNVKGAAVTAGYGEHYCYKLRDRLAKAITQAAQEYLAVHSVKAAVKLVDSIDCDMPNPLHITAAQALLDRVGLIKRDPYAEGAAQPVIKANIFILPEKRMQEAIEVAFTET